MKDIANFLGGLYKKGLKYSTLCGYRSAISSYHDNVDGLKVGEHPTLIRLIKGVFNLRPPSRQLQASWDLGLVLRKLRGKPFEPLADVSARWLTLKTALLVALSTAGRSSDITKLGCKEPYLRWERNPAGIRFVTRGLRKQDRASHLLKDIYVSGFDKDKLLDPVRAVRIYLRRTKERRGSLASLFITYGAGAPKSPSAQSFSRWVVDAIRVCLGSQGGLCSVKAHSTRGMSSSVAFWQGVKLEDILKAADWSSDCTFARHYLRPCRQEEGQFSRAVLGASQL